MDEQDFAILAHLVREPSASLAAVARAVKMSRSAVQVRYARLLRDGPLVGFDLMPNPALFGKVAILAAFAPPERPPKPMEKVLEVDGVIGYSVNHDGQVAVTYYADGADDGPPAALEELLGGPAPRRFVRHTPPLEARATRLSPFEWRLLEALIPDPRARDAKLAGALGRDARTVARARRRLLEAGVFRIIPGILSDRASGVVVFHLYIQGAGTKDSARVLRALPSSALIERLVEPPGLFVFCRAGTVGEALAMREKAARLPGIEHVEIILESEGKSAEARLARMCRERAKLKS